MISYTSKRVLLEQLNQQSQVGANRENNKLKRLRLQRKKAVARPSGSEPRATEHVPQHQSLVSNLLPLLRTSTGMYYIK